MIQKPASTRAFKIIVVLIILAAGIFLFNKNKTMPQIPDEFEVLQFDEVSESSNLKNEVLIGVIADTHIPTRVKRMPEEVKKIFQNVDLIIHAGDIETLEVLKELEMIAPVCAIEGNWESDEVKETLLAGRVLEIFDFRIGIVHSPNPFWLGSHFNTVQEYIAPKLARKHNFDILVFGHTHRPLLKNINLGKKDVLLFNPGSPTTPFLSQASVGLLKVSRDSFSGEIIYLEI